MGNIAVVDLETGEQLKHHPSQVIFKNDLEGHYSHSFIKTYAGCSAAGVLKKMKAPQRTAYALERGSAVHAALEAFMKEGKDPFKVFDEEWQKNVADKVMHMKPSDQKKVCEREYEESVRMIREWLYENTEYSKALANVKPEDVEVEFSLPVTLVTDKGSFQRRFFGKLDLIQHMKDGSYNLFDWKTSASAPDEEEIDFEPQFTLYQWAAEQLFGKPPAQMFFYLLKGVHLCDEKFSAKAHPRDIDKRKPGCEIMYAFKVPLRTDEQIKDYFNNYCAGNIIKYESGVVAKDGYSDYRNKCARCTWQPYCKTFDVSAPRYIKVENDDAVPSAE